MRDFLRRGKSIDNEKWVYGNIVFTRSGRAFLLEGSFFSGESHEGDFKHGEIYGTEVIPETVGRYTGLKDKNGKRIFEGDIVKGSWNTVFVVFWDTDYLQFRARTKGSKGYFREIDFFRGRNGIEVIGNLHDNPELLKGE